MNRVIASSLIAVLAFCAPGFVSAQETPEGRKAAAAQVFTNDNLQRLIRNSHISVVGSEGAVPAVSAKVRAVEVREAVDKPAHAVKNFVLKISPACGSTFSPPWCAAPGDGVSSPREIEVDEGDEVEITLVNDPAWTKGQSSFLLTGADVIEDCAPDAMGRKKDLSSDEAAKCAAFPQFGVSYAVAPASSRVIRFTADKAGTYKFYDGMNRSGYGVLRVNP